MFWVNVPVGVYGTVWAYLRLRDNGERHRARIDWWGNITFAVGLSAVLIAVTYGIQPYGGHTMGWTNPWVLAGLAGGTALLAAFAVLETRIAEPMFQLSLFRIRAFTAGNLAGLAVAIARGGLQFMLIIWLQGIWLPLHGYDYSQTPLWAGIFLLPLTAGFLVSGPVAGFLSDRFGSRGIATAGMAVFGGSFVGLMLLPVNFPYPGLLHQGVPSAAARQIGSLPPVSSLFAAVLGVNPLGHLLAARGVLSALPAAARQTITGREFFPDLISGPFARGLVVVFALATVLTGLARPGVRDARRPRAGRAARRGARAREIPAKRP